MQNVGVDGCPVGWFAVFRRHSRLEFSLFSTIRELITAFEGAHQILVDVPIGLPWSDIPIRPCDRMARQTLGKPRSSSVFPVPCREALAAADLTAARAINSSVLGRSLNAQTWGISGKIAEVDSMLLSGNEKAHIREIHPEICFWSLAGRRPMRHKKSSAEGIEERQRVLKKYEPSAAAFFSRVLKETRRKVVRADDILDALAAFVTADIANRRSLSSLAGQPSRDLKGLPMEMLYIEPDEQPGT